MSKNKSLAIIGCGGHAKSVADVAIRLSYNNVFFLDPNAGDNETILGLRVYRKVPNKVLSTSLQFAPGVGDNQTRKQIIKELLNHNDELVNISSPSAYLAKDSKLGGANFIGHNAYIGPNAVIGDGCIINTASVVEHDCEVGSFSHISVNTTLAGKVKIGSNCFIGAGATIIDGVEITDNVTVGAGAVVVADINTPGTYLGVPARLHMVSAK